MCKINGYVVYDHLGNMYENNQRMCEHYSISYSTYERRRKAGYTLEQSLTMEKQNVHTVSDHLGNVFKNVRDMCKHYGISCSTYKRRRKAGYTLEQSLTSPKYLRNPKYLTFGDNACTEEQRKRYGRYAVKDYNGKIFRSEKEMCKHHGVNYDTYQDRKFAGWSLYRCLTNKQLYLDHLGNRFASKREMCRHWCVPFTTYEKRQAKGYSIEECLGVMPVLKATVKNIQVDDNFLIIRGIAEDNWDTIYFHCIENGEEIIMARDEMLAYYRKHVLQTA